MDKVYQAIVYEISTYKYKKKTLIDYASKRGPNSQLCSFLQTQSQRASLP